MENAPRLYDAVFSMLGQHAHWRDVRHLKTLCWMVVGLLLSSKINLTDWLDYTWSRAMFAQSIQRRFSRWLANSRIQERKLYAPLIRQALSEWKATRLVLALDTSLLWNCYCLIRVSLIYRGRAIPVMWKVMVHKSSSVAHSDYSKLLYTVATVLPQGTEILFLADRGFAESHCSSNCDDSSGITGFGSSPVSISTSASMDEPFRVIRCALEKRSFFMLWR